MGQVVFVLKGYPRLSETFIAQEILGLEQRGLDILIVSLRPPREEITHPIHSEISADVHYLPERLRDSPRRVLAAFNRSLFRRRFARVAGAFIVDFVSRPSWDRLTRFGQAVTLAAELPDTVTHLHAHFLHSPATVTRYAAMLTGLEWSCSAHAKDIWTTGASEARTKLREASWVTVCTRNGFEQLAATAEDPTKIHLNYHGIDLKRFETGGLTRAGGSGTRDAPVVLLSVGRAVTKKGFDVLLQALSDLPHDIEWSWHHVGDGDELASLKRLAQELGISERITWHGGQPQQTVVELYRKADIFVLPSRVAADGDRDGLPNVLMEAFSQELPVISTRVSGIPELVDDGVTGLLVAPDDAEALKRALEDLVRSPQMRAEMGLAASRHLRENFDHNLGLDALVTLFSADWKHSRERASSD